MTVDRTQMINLCVIAYEDAKDIATAVCHYDPHLEVVWGPAWKSNYFGDPYSLSFICQDTVSGDVTVVIRGTNPYSLQAWLDEDFDIDHTVAFDTFAPDAPVDAEVSQGTANGLNDLLQQVPEAGYPGQHTAMMTFLRGLPADTAVTVTGHSLGGTLTGPLFAALKAHLPHLDFDLMSFAGLTPGNQAFADWLQTQVPHDGWRVVNPLDIAPLCFTTADAVTGIYDRYGLDAGGWGEVVRLLFDQAAIQYVQPGQPALLKADFAIGHDWPGEALHQHHSTTYLALITED